MDEGEAGAGSGPKMEDIPKLLALGLAVLYLLGFLVVARYLSEYGVSPTSILKLQYLIAGIWLLVPLVIPFLYFAAAFVGLAFFIQKKPSGQKEDLTSRNRWKRAFTEDLGKVIFAGLVAIPFAVIVVVVAGFGLGSLHGAYTSLYKTLIVENNLPIWAGFFIGTVGLALAAAYTGHLARTKGEDKFVEYTALTLYLGGLCVLTLLWYASYFARNWYSLIPYSYGGGKPASVVFLLKTEKGREESPVVADSSGTRSTPYKLLFATDKTFVVLSPSKEEKAIEFNRDAVLGVVMLNAEEGPTPKSTQ